MTQGRQTDFDAIKIAMPQKARANSGRPLPRRVIRERRRRINAYLREHPGASCRTVAFATGLTEKQIYRAMHMEDVRREKQQAEEFVYRRFGLCQEQPETCGPCARCLGACPKCHKPVMKNQDRSKVWVGKNGDQREAPIHLVCKE